MIAMSKFATKADYWEHRAELAEKLLREVYELHGPGSRGPKGKEPVESFAALTLAEAQEEWDFSDLELMLKIAKHLANHD